MGELNIKVEEKEDSEMVKTLVDIKILVEDSKK